MGWEGVTEFVYVAELGSFTKASHKLGVSTAQVSRQVRNLEQRLNATLLYRTTRQVTLTEAGNTYYHHCRHVLDGLEDAERALLNLQSKPQGRIKITMPVTYGDQHILPLLNDFMVQYPEVQVSGFLSNYQVDLIHEGYDLAIRLGKLEDSRMVYRKLASRLSYVCASPEYIARHGQVTSLSCLAKHRCLLGTLDAWRFVDSGVERAVRIKEYIRFNSGLGLVDAALKGLGVVQLPDYYVAKHLQSGALVSMLDEYQTKDEGVWAIFPDRRFLSPKVRLLIDFLAEQLGDK